jgi:hypothetical protein
MTKLTMKNPDLEYQESLKHFNVNYHAFVISREANKKIVIDKNLEQICRFCKRKAPEVKFRQKAHALPELIGNRYVFIKTECDDCNKFFSENLEDHFAKFLRVCEKTSH